MFSRFNEYLTAHRTTLATFGADQIDGFFSDLEYNCQPGTTTRLRYLKLIDRLSRHLVAQEIRTNNPAAQLLTSERWPEDEPTPVYLSGDDDVRVQTVCGVRQFESFKDLRNTAIVALFLGSGVAAAELQQLTVDDLDVTSARVSVIVKKHGPRIARRVPVDLFAVDVMRTYHGARVEIPCPTNWLFVATAGGKPMKADTLGSCVRAALRSVGTAAADESPRLLRNTYGRRHLSEGKSNEQVSGLLGLSSHRTATRLRQTLWQPDPAPGSIERSA
ncbi:site-specific integrase [Paraburkholderia sp. BL10I2N1]|uniref:tyrosine-type recombinase/integrase n=1 Tax=Paraburkholderia sp. BL10I2N1 TaxID=1938796 RepID=UPI001FB795A5|nr:site-specific integrase [Paraburkholderia sp. BL10I2N1]